MGRRHLITAVGEAALWPGIAQTQQASMPMEDLLRSAPRGRDSLRAQLIRTTQSLCKKSHWHLRTNSAWLRPLRNTPCRRSMSGGSSSTSSRSECATTVLASQPRLATSCSSRLPSRPARALASVCRSPTTLSRSSTVAASLWTAGLGNTENSRYGCLGIHKRGRPPLAP
jgi:hypothetical protein